MTRKLEWGLGLMATAVLVFFHAVFLRSAGALWRDEVNSVNLATTPLPEFWQNLQFDSFPVAWCSLLRAWIAAGPGSTDLGLRVLGLLLGLGILAVLWWNARRFGHGIPLVALVLLGFDSAVICYGDSIRAYGLGMLLGLLTFGLVWEVTNRPTAGRVLSGTVAAVASVHCLFYNAVLLLAACAGGTAVAARRRQWRTVGVLAGMGLVAAVSLLPYRGMTERQKTWSFIVRSSIDLPWIWTKFLEATASTGPFAHTLWLACAAAALVVAVAAWAKRSRGAADERRDVVVYCGAALLTGVVGYVLFLLRLSYPMQPWYFLALFALVAACADGILGAFLSARFGAARTAAAVVVLALAVSPVWESIRVRKTNVDRIASTLTQSAAAGDLVVVSPWYYGITFDRYYRGAADWVTIPPISFHKLHRYDLLRDAMASPGLNQLVLDRIEAALRTGHRIWWIGDIAVPPEGQAPPVLPPASRAPWGWNEFPYYRGWGMQAGHVLRLHALRAQEVPIPSDRPVSPYENLPLRVIEGWR